MNLVECVHGVEPVVLGGSSGTHWYMIGHGGDTSIDIIRSVLVGLILSNYGGGVVRRFRYMVPAEPNFDSYWSLVRFEPRRTDPPSVIWECEPS